MNLDELKYPIGKFIAPQQYETSKINEWIEEIKNLPAQLEEAITGLSEEQLNTPYRPDGWTIRQVVHHIADSHMNSYMRVRLALTENKPVIKPYDEVEWAKLADYHMDVMISVQTIKGLHARWTCLLKSISSEELRRTYIHPEHNKEFNLEYTIGLYAWHGKHHLEHIRALKRRNSW